VNSDAEKPYDMITDYVSGRKIPDIGTETHRQAVEKILVEEKGYPVESIGVDVPLSLEVGGEPYNTQLDLVVRVDNQPFMVIKCAAGSLESRQKEVVAAARVLGPVPLPRAVVSDGHTAMVYDGLTRKKIGEGMDQIPSHAAAGKIMEGFEAEPVDAQMLEREKIIFRSYDSMNLNVQRNLSRL
jgi:hypothetical protein